MQRADELRRATYALNFTPPPGEDLKAGSRACYASPRADRAMWTPPPLSPPPAAAGPGPEALRLHVNAEIMAAAGFTRDRLYIEYAVAFDPELWALHSPAGAALEEPGLFKVCAGPGRGRAGRRWDRRAAMGQALRETRAP
jgi:hypothetical protein